MVGLMTYGLCERLVGDSKRNCLAAVDRVYIIQILTVRSPADTGASFRTQGYNVAAAGTENQLHVCWISPQKIPCDTPEHNTVPMIPVYKELTISGHINTDSCPDTK